MLSLAVLFTTANTLAGSPTKNSAIIGQWKGTMEGLPAVALVVEEDDGKLIGSDPVLPYSPQPGRRAKRLSRISGADD